MAYRNIIGLCLVWLMAGCLLSGQAQDLCTAGGGGFSINGVSGTGPVTGCAPFNVSVANTVTGANNIQYNFDYKGGTLPGGSAASSFNYTKPGRYRILQVGSSGATGISACREVIVLSTAAPNVLIQACPGNVVKLTIVKDSISNQYDQFQIIWNDNSPPLLLNKGDSLVVSHQYAITGTYAIPVRGIYLNGGSCPGGATARPTIRLIQNPVSGIAINDVQVGADGSVALTMTGIQDLESEVLVKMGSGNYSFTNIKTSQGGSQKLTIPSLDPKQVYCFKIRTKDACGNTSESNAVCTMLLNGKAESERNVLTWNQTIETQGFVRYDLLKNGTVIKTTTDFREVSYIDNNVQCGVSYRYQVIAYSDKARSVSLPIEVTAKSDVKPGVVSGALVTVDPNGSVSIVAFLPTQGASSTYKMVFERAESPNGEFREIGTTTNVNRYTDITINSSEKPYCYRVRYENACGTRSDPSEAICTIFLKKAGNTIRWTNDIPFTDDIGSYFVVRINPDGSSTETGVGLNTSYDSRLDDPNEQQFNYQIRTRSKNGIYLSYSNIIVFRREAALFIPDAFSPNGDGINDVFEARGIFFDNYTMIIYSRWGQSIYQTTNAGQGWDGTVGGERAPEGNYSYKIIIKDNTGTEFVKAGTLMLLR